MISFWQKSTVYWKPIGKEGINQQKVAVGQLNKLNWKIIKAKSLDDENWYGHITLRPVKTAKCTYIYNFDHTGLHIDFHRLLYSSVTRCSVISPSHSMNSITFDIALASCSQRSVTYSSKNTLTVSGGTSPSNMTRCFNNFHNWTW